MIKTIKYSSIESITYKFTEHEIMEALMKRNDIKMGNNEYEKLKKWYTDNKKGDT